MKKPKGNHYKTSESLDFKSGNTLDDSTMAVVITELKGVFDKSKVSYK